MADELEPWEHGTVVRTPTLPEYWNYNCVRVERDPGPDAAALIARVDTLQAGLRHRKAEVEDEAAGARLRPGFAAAGWQHERLAFMRRAGPPPAPRERVEEAPFSATRTLRAEWYSDGPDPGGFLAFARAQEAVTARRGVRAFVVREHGEPIGFASLAADRGAVEIEQLYVRPERRGTGIGRALLETALAAGGAEVAWVVADDEGRARALYERVGFAAVWRRHAFTRTP